MNLPEKTNHTQLRTNIYREALRTLWDLEAEKPDDCASGEYRQWDAQHEAQIAAYDLAFDDLMSELGIAASIQISSEEWKVWKLGQETQS